MASTYVNDLRLEEIADGEQSGTWGATTNTNLELIGEALGFGTQAITTNADTFASTVADGAADAERAMYIKYTGTLDSACTITIGPNTISRMHFIENGTSGSQNIIISQGSGANVTIPPGDTKAVYLDGAGSGAAVVDAFASLSVVDLKVQDDLTVTDDATIGGRVIIDDTTDATSTTDGSLQTDGGLSVAKDTIIGNDLKLLSDSAVLVFGAGGDATLTHTNDVGLTLNGTNKLMFNDASQFIQGASATVLDIAATDTIELTATNIAVVGTMGATGKITADAGIDIDNINIDGTTIALSSGDLTLDVAGDIILDADGGDIILKDGGTQFGTIVAETGGLGISSAIVQDSDIIFKGNDGGGVITALTLDMSNAGAASFNGNIFVPDNKVVSLGAGGDIALSSNGTNGTIAAPNGDLTVDVGGVINLDSDGGGIYFKDAGTTIAEFINNSSDFELKVAVQDKDIRFRGNDGGTAINALKLDMSDAGRAIFNSRANFNGGSNEGILTIAANTTAMDTNTNHQITLQNTSQTTSAKGLINYKTASDSGSGFVPVAFGGRTINPANATRTGAFVVYVSDTDNVDIGNDEKLRVTHDGNLLVGTTNATVHTTNDDAGVAIRGDGGVFATRLGADVAAFNRGTNDGTIVQIMQGGSAEGTISISGTTTSYNGGHLSRWSRLLDNSKDTSIVKGTVMTNLDEMVEWGDEDNEQLNKMAVSSVEGDANVAGVFVNWDDDDDWNDMNVAMTGDMVIRIAQGTTVARGDLLMSAGDGTAKTQGDDIVRSKTIAKVTSISKSHTYDDGTYLVPCVLMAC